MNIERVTRLFRERGILYIKPDSREQRLEIIKLLESDGFSCPDKCAQDRKSVINDTRPLHLNLAQKTVQCVGNVTCAAAAASQKIIINPELFYNFYWKWKENTQTVEV